MNRTRSPLAAAFAPLVALLALASSSARAQDFSGLEGKTLNRFEDLEMSAANGVRELLGPGRNLNGRIDRVTVREDSERRLIVAIAYSGFAAVGLQAAVLDQAKRAQPWLNSPRVTVDPAATQIEMTIELGAEAPEGTALESTYLRLAINKPGQPVGKELLFLLPKRWQRAIRPENVIVTVRPAPIGRAARHDAAEANRYRLDAAPPASPPPPPGAGGGMVARPLPARERAVVRRHADIRPTAVRSHTESRAFSLTTEFGNRLVVDLRPAAAGRITVEATWAGAAPLALILNGPGQVSYYAREDGASPRRLEFDLTPELLARGEGWRLSVVNFSRVVVRGQVQVTYPSASASVQSTLSTTRVLIPQTLALRQRADFTAGLSSAQVDSGLGGPSAEAIDLLESLESDVNFELHRLSEILGLSARVYPDRNAASGTFYFLPRAYHLRWDPSGQYAMNILYRTDAPDTITGQVQMSAHLQAGIGTNDLGIAGLLLQAYIRRHNRTFPELRLLRMPLDLPPRLSLTDNLRRLYDIPDDRVVIREISDALAELRVDWVTDSRTATDMQTELVAHGLSGQAVLDPQGQAVSAQSIPVEISLRDPGTYGLLSWRRGEAWRNETRYPVTVKRLHALMIDVRDRVPRVLSWALGDSVIPSQARLTIDTSTVPAWVDTLALRTWIEYGVAQNCEPCDRQALADIRGGAFAQERQLVTFRTLTPLSDVGAYALSVQIRSRYLQPEARGVQNAPAVTLNADGRDFPACSIYPPVVDAEAPSADPLPPSFEYLVSVVMPDGTEHPGTTWIPSTRPNVFIGSAQIRQSLGFLPGQPNN